MRSSVRCWGSERFKNLFKRLRRVKRLRGVKPCFRFTVGITLAKLRAWLDSCGSNFRRDLPRDVAGQRPADGVPRRQRLPAADQGPGNGCWQVGMGLALLCPDAQSLPLAGTDAKAQPLAGNAASHIRIRQLVQPTSSASGAHISGPVQSELIEDESYYPGTEEVIRTQCASEGSASEPAGALGADAQGCETFLPGDTSGPSAATSSSIPCGANACSPITLADRGPGRAIRATTAGGGRVGWVAYEALHSAWRGESGGNDPEAAYRRFVEQGLARAPANPFQSAAHGWLLGSETFIEGTRSLLSEPRNQD